MVELVPLASLSQRCGSDNHHRVKRRQLHPDPAPCTFCMHPSTMHDIADIARAGTGDPAPHALLPDPWMLYPAPCAPLQPLPNSPITEEQLQDWVSDTVGWQAVEITAAALMAAGAHHSQAKALVQAALQAGQQADARRCRFTQVPSWVGEVLHQMPLGNLLSLSALGFHSSILPLDSWGVTSRWTWTPLYASAWALGWRCTPIFQSLYPDPWTLNPIS